MVAAEVKEQRVELLPLQRLGTGNKEAMKIDNSTQITSASLMTQSTSKQ
jgi:hypothetical protein